LEQALDERRLGRRDASEATCRAILAAEPGEPRALGLLGALLLEAGRAGEAEDVLRRRLSAGDPTAETLHNLALARAAQGQFGEAAVYFSRAIVQRPGYVSAYYNLALALQAEGEADKAAAVFQRVLELEPDHAQAWNNLGILHHGKGELAEAKDCYRRALAADPEVQTTRANLAGVLRSLGDRDGARAVFDEALAHNPRDPLAHYILAQLDYIQGDVDAATKKLAVALGELIGTTGWLVHAVAGARRIPRYNMARYRECVAAVLNATSAAGIEACLLCGTLLGAIRDGDVIGFDKDTDFGIDASVTPAMLDLALSKDERFRRVGSLADDEILPCYFFEGVPVDFFRLYREGETLWYGMRWRGHLIQFRHRNFGLRDFPFLGLPARIPDDSERYLVEVYGEAWREPDPYFAAWASPNIVGGFPSVCRCVAYANIFKAAWSGAGARASRYCEQALMLDPGDQLVADLLQVLSTHASRLAAPQGTFLDVPDDPFDQLK
jgi:tetratricopeptide (TPR) repeat protein